MWNKTCKRRMSRNPRADDGTYCVDRAKWLTSGDERPWHGYLIGAATHERVAQATENGAVSHFLRKNIGWIAFSVDMGN